jgi:syntaxin 8
MASTHQLLLLADHIKLSLLERQRALSLNLRANTQDTQISRSLASLKDGIDKLSLEIGSSDEDELLELEQLRQQYDSLAKQFINPNAADSETAKPNNPSLQADFDHASSIRPPAGPRTNSKSVRFRDNDSSIAAPTNDGAFPYRDDPDEQGTDDHVPAEPQLDNQQIHAYHNQVLEEQDEHLDRLGESIGRTREMTMHIGEELDSQVFLLDDIESGVDRHQSGLGRAQGRLRKIAKDAAENWSLTVIILLIVILVILIAVLK